LLAAVCIFILPVVFSPYAGDKLTGAAPFSTVAYAGHTLGGDWCACGTPGCICGPDGLSSRNVPDQTKTHPDASPIREHSRSGFDFGSAALILALSLFVWTRLRA
jgi:hypothetical protein